MGRGLLGPQHATLHWVRKFLSPVPSLHALMHTRALVCSPALQPLCERTALLLDTHSHIISPLVLCISARVPLFVCMGYLVLHLYWQTRIQTYTYTPVTHIPPTPTHIQTRPLRLSDGDPRSRRLSLRSRPQHT